MVSNVLECRAEVQHFAVLMERKLRENDYKPGWKHEQPNALLARAHVELEEFEQLVMEGIQKRHFSPELRQRLREEGPDFPNFIMFVLDAIGALEIDEIAPASQP